MRRCPAGVRGAFHACGLLGLVMAGCMPFGYAYPTVSYIPPLSVGPVRDEVRAFRVDVTDDDNSPEFKEKDRYVLRALPLHRDGSSDAQTKVAMDYGWVWNSLTVLLDETTHHTMLVRLYRPGFQTVEVESWQKAGPIDWVTAPTIDEQERAIDDLVSTWNTAPARLQVRMAREEMSPPRDPILFRYLAPGSASAGHARALRFAAGEYDRLVSETTDPDTRSRLQEKAKALRRLATL